MMDIVYMLRLFSFVFKNRTHSGDFDEGNMVVDA